MTLNNRIEQLIKMLNEYDDLYHNGIGSPITDTEYDLLKNELKELDPQNSYFNKVGSKSKNGKKVKLPYILGSLDKLKSDKVMKWCLDDNNLVLSAKLDGATIYVEYLNGCVIFATTRGDGYEGNDITEKAKHFLPIIDEKSHICLRGEALFSGDTYKKYGYSNRRNGVSGLLNRDDINPNDLKDVTVVFYEVIKSPVELKTEIERLQYISELGLNCVDYTIEWVYIVDHLKQILFNFKEKSIYDIDGLVITRNKSERENVFYPKDKICFKVNEESIKVNVIGIDWNVGRSGRIVPTVIFNPVEINGTTVVRATGFNAEYVIENGIGKGSVIGIVKSGEIIPYITEIYEKTSVELNNCPSCDGDIQWSGVDLICSNINCEGSKTKKIAHFFKVLGAEYISETTVRNLGVETIEEMYELDEFDIANIDGFGMKKAEQIVNEIQKTLKTTPDKLLAAFSIPGISIENAKIVISKNNWNNIFDIKEDDVGLGPKTSKKLVDNINIYRPLYNFLLENGLSFKEIEHTNISGKIFALTGSMPMKRDYITRLIENKGGIVKTVTKSTDYLVASDISSNSSKLKNATKYDIKIIDFDELMLMLEN